MKQEGLLLCTDMDRTVIPNGHHPEHPKARRCFRDFCRLPEVELVYVTGRHQQLVEEAIDDYDLPVPDYVITDVGTRIYRVQTGTWEEVPAWQEEIAADWGDADPQRLAQLLAPVTELTPQEPSKQSRFKLSYYLPLQTELPPLFERIESLLAPHAIASNMVWSVDEARVGLLDLLPRRASKLHALLFLQQRLTCPLQQMLFAGDSGNDLQVLGSEIPAVLVANACAEVREQALALAARNGQRERLLLAAEQAPPLGGNYAAGVLQGVAHFAPHYHSQLSAIMSLS